MIQGLLILNHENYEAQRWHVSLIYWGLVVLGTVTNIWGSRFLSVVERSSLIIHVLAFIAISAVVWACSPAKHSADFVFTLFENNSGWTSDGIAWSLGMLSSSYVLAGEHCPKRSIPQGNNIGISGYDGAIHLGEEMANPEVAVPYCMLGSVAINGSMGFVFLLAILFCMGDMQTALDSATGYPIIEIFRGVTGSKGAGSAMVSMLILAAWLATIALLASTSRMVWSLTRDKGTIFSRVIQSELTMFQHYPAMHTLLNSIAKRSYLSGRS
jgi:amino acid transporter